MRITLLVYALGGITLLGAIVVLARRRRERADLGTISESWIAQHRASWSDPNR